jgi:hypothetical protein
MPDLRLTEADIDVLMEGIEQFIIGPFDPPDPDLVEVWGPYINKLRALQETIRLARLTSELGEQTGASPWT